MAKILFTTMLLSIVCSLSMAADQPPSIPDPKMQEMMKKYQEAATPGKPHKMLAELAGNWKYTSKMWETADAKPNESKGTTTFKSVLGGRWLEQSFKGDMHGQKFEGIGFIGYDNVKGKYQSMWMDTMSTGVMKGEGTFDEATKTLKDQGTASCPISADKTQEFRSDWELVNKKKMVFSMYGKGPTEGPEFKMLEIVYTK